MYSFSKSIEKEYKKDNYRVIDIPNGSDTCIVFFASHAIYFPDTEENFLKTVTLKDRYEWINTASAPPIFKNAGRVILCRDLWKQFYVMGLNERENTIQKTIRLLRQMTNGMKIITVGSSAGGYMAVVSGILLGAEYVINNGGRFDITGALSNDSMISNACRNPDNSCYLNAVGLLAENKVPIYYFYADKNDTEVENYNYVRKYDCVKCLAFNEKKHATSVLPGNWAYIILHQELLQSLYEKSQKTHLNKIKVLFGTVPKRKAICLLIYEIGEVMRRIGRK